MSLNVLTITVGEKQFDLRLTSKAIMNFCKKHGTDGGSPVIAIMEAINDIEAKADLLTNALSYPGSTNAIKDGFTLLDLMADDPGWKEPKAKNGLLLSLAHESGLLDDEDYDSLVAPVADSSKALISTLSRLLTGKPVEAQADGDAEKPEAENPT